ncbi:unnamed protein product [Auanema sp. JU1783]|nr:unnamed protein product [Auanema sp. JU1783]
MNTLITCLLFVIFPMTLLLVSANTEQGYKVKGAFLCGTTQARNVQVKLIEDDFGQDTDDVLDECLTDQNGSFELKGKTKERTKIDPQLKIYHDCNDGIKPCQRRWKFELPLNYVSKDGEDRAVLDIGTWNLELIMPGETRDCSH